MSRRVPNTRGVSVRGTFLRQRREALGLTQEDLEHLSGVTSRTIQTAERGGVCSYSTVRSLAAAVAIPYSQLVRLAPEQMRAALRAAGLAPRKPPAPWFGRQTELEWAATRLAATSARACCLAGPTGIGKTALAAQLAVSCAEQFPDGVVWVHAAQAKLTDTLLVIAQALGFAEQLPPSGRVPAASWDDCFQAQLWQHKVLVILDEVASMRHVHHFVGERGTEALIATTTSRAVAAAFGAEHLVLPPLLPSDIERIVAHYVASDRLVADRSGTDELLGLVSGSPRAAHIAGSILAVEPATTPSGLARRIGHAPTTFAHELDVATDQWEQRQASLFAAFDQALAVGSAATQSFFATLAVFGQLRFPCDYSAAVAGVGEDEATSYLHELADRHLVFERDAASALPAAPWWGLDTHAAWFAKAKRDQSPTEALLRLGRHALDQLRQAMTVSPANAWECLTAHRALWRLWFDEAVATVCAGYDTAQWILPESVPRLPRHPVLGDLIIDAAVALVPLVAGYFVPEARDWLFVAFAMAQEDGQRAQLALGVDRWFHRCGADPIQEMVPWIASAAQLAQSLPNPARSSIRNRYAVMCTNLLSRHDEACVVWHQLAEEFYANGWTLAGAAAQLCVAISTFDGGGEWRPGALAQIDAVLDRVGGMDGELAERVARVADYNRAAIIAATGGAHHDLRKAVDGLERLTLVHELAPLGMRLEATASYFGTTSDRELRGLVRRTLLPKDDATFERHSLFLGELAAYTALRGFVAPNHGFARHGLWPCDVHSESTVPELQGVALPIVYALDPLLEAIDWGLLSEVVERAERCLGSQHHVLVYLRQWRDSTSGPGERVAGNASAR